MATFQQREASLVDQELHLLAATKMTERRAKKKTGGSSKKEARTCCFSINYTFKKTVWIFAQSLPFSSSTTE